MIELPLNQAGIKYVMDELDLSIGDFVKVIALKVWTSLTYKTPVGNPTLWSTPAPVGYIGGQARSSWNISPKKPDTSTPQSWSTALPPTPTIKNEGYDVVYVTSSIPYMDRLENEGWSSQGSHMQSRTMSEIKFEFESIGI